jgi:hypothetical protein
MHGSEGLKKKKKNLVYNMTWIYAWDIKVKKFTLHFIQLNLH